MKAVLVSVVVLFSASVFAGGVEMKKAKKSGDEKIAEEVKKFKEKCGTDLKVESKHEEASKIKEEGRDEANMVSVAGSICGEVVYALTSLCSDADYKEEVAKVKTVKCMPKKFEKRPYWAVKKDGATISVEHNPTTSNYSEGIDMFKKLF